MSALGWFFLATGGVVLASSKGTVTGDWVATGWVGIWLATGWFEAKPTMSWLKGEGIAGSG